MKFETFEEYKRRLEKEKDNRIDGKENIKSLTELNEKMISTRVFVENERKQIDETMYELSKEFQPQAVAKKRASREKELEELCAELRKETKKEIIEMLGHKRDMIADMLKTPPEESTRNLLSVLNLRRNISEEEISLLSAILFDNYQAVQALASISEQNGVQMHLPEQLNIRSLYDGLNEAESFLLGACEDMCKPKPSRNIKFNAFFFRSKEDPKKIQDPVFAELVELFDHVPQLQEIKSEKTQLSPVEALRMEWIFKEVDKAKSDTEVLDRTREVMEKYPGDLSLMKLSTYAPLIEIVEIADASAKDNN